MKIIRNGHPGTGSEARTSTFTGLVYADAVLPAADGAAVTSVFFGPGGRTYWHSHGDGQIILAVAGAGLICAEGGPVQALRAGDVVWSPPGERHWHGGGPETTLLHLAVSLGTTTWLQEVTGEEYGAAAAGQ